MSVTMHYDILIPCFQYTVAIIMGPPLESLCTMVQAIGMLIKLLDAPWA